MNINDIESQLIKIFGKYKKILVYIKGSPDPDAIASAYALHTLGIVFQSEVYIYSQNDVSLPQNAAIISKLAIPFNCEDNVPVFSDFDAYAVLDHQSPFIKECSLKIPCAIHIDHHAPEEHDIEVDLSVISDEIGSVSTLFAHVIKNIKEKYDEELLNKVSTALAYGIQTDTNNLVIGTKLDKEAMDFLSLHSNMTLLSEINETPFEPETINILSRAIINKQIHKDWAFSGVGVIEESYRDSIAIVADFILKKEKNLKVVIIYALVKDKNPDGMHIDASFRSRDKDLDLNKIIKRITSNGGGRSFKGAFQVDMDFFLEYPEEKKLWEIVKSATEMKIVKIRDTITFEEIKGFIGKFRTGFKKIFKSFH